MRPTTYISIVVVVSCATSLARADMIITPSRSDDVTSCLATSASRTACKAVFDEVTTGSVFDVVAEVTRLPQPVPAEQEAPSTVTQLPAGPSSVSLFLFALGSCGAVRAGRSAKRLHFGLVPDWFHAEGPAQIGHASAIDITCDALPICHADESAKDKLIRQFALFAPPP